MTQKLKIPDTILEQHDKFLHTLWVEAERYIEENKQELKVYWERELNNLNKQYVTIANELNGLKEKHHVLLGDYNQLDHSNQLLEKGIEQRSSDLRASQQQQAELNAKNAKFLEEIKQLTLDFGRVSEHRDMLQKQVEKDHMQVNEEQERNHVLSQEIQIYQNNSKHNEEEIQHLQEELAKVNNQLRMESHKATVAETLATEVHSQKELGLHEIIQLKSQLKAAQEKIEVSQKSFEDANKRVSNLQTQAEMQANFTQKNISQLEIELKASKAELQELRQRVIKAESAAERERKAVERLENKLLTVKR